MSLKEKEGGKKGRGIIVLGRLEEQNWGILMRKVLLISAQWQKEIQY